MEGAAPGAIVPLQLDVTDGGADRDGGRARRRRAPGASVPGGLDALVNNAGIGLGGPLEVISRRTGGGSSTSTSSDRSR